MTQDRDAIIDAGKRVERFLADDAVRGAIERLEQKYVADWKAALTTQERETLHAKVAVVGDLQLELRAIVGNGQHAQVTREREQRVRGRNRQG